MMMESKEVQNKIDELIQKFTSLDFTIKQSIESSLITTEEVLENMDKNSSKFIFWNSVKSQLETDKRILNNILKKN